MKIINNTVTELMAQYFINKAVIKELKSERIEFMSSVPKCTGDANLIGDYYTCVERQKFEPRVIVEMCPNCKRRHEFYLKLSKLSRANGGIMNKVRCLVKLH